MSNTTNADKRANLHQIIGRVTAGAIRKDLNQKMTSSNNTPPQRTTTSNNMSNSTNQNLKVNNSNKTKQ